MTVLHLFRVAWFTFFQAACSTILALLIGLPSAFFCGRRTFPGRKGLLSLSVVPFCVPSIIIALGYVTFLGLNGGLNKFFMFLFGLEEPPVKILYSFAGLIIAHGFYNFPLIMKTVADSWNKLPCEQAESARLLGAGEGRIFRTVTIYQLLPSIASSSMLVFIYCFLSFIMVLLFGGIGNTTLEVEIYKAARATLDFKQAASLGIIETVILCIVTTLYCILEQKSSRAKGLSSPYSSPLRKIRGSKEIIVFTIVMILIFAFFVSPLLGIVVNAFTSSKKGVGLSLANFALVLKMRSFWPSVKSTVTTALYTATCCSVLGFLYSVLVKFKEQKGGKGLNLFLKIFPMIPMSISSVVVGVIITLLVKRGSVATLVIAQTALTWPLAFRQIYSQMVKITSDTMDSASILSKNKLQVITRILLPVSKGALFSAFGFCFAVSAGDTTLPLVLAIPKYDALSLFTYRLSGSYRFNEACSAGLILALICALMYILGQAKKKPRGRI